MTYVIVGLTAMIFWFTGFTLGIYFEGKRQKSVAETAYRSGQLKGYADACAKHHWEG